MSTAFSKEKTITVTVDDYKTKDAVFSHEFVGKEGHACFVEVLPDHDSGSFENPRDWDNLWTWVTTRNAGYSDKNAGTPEGYEDPETGKLDKAWLKTVIIRPLYLYRHSGDVISVGRFPAGSPCDCRWDSGCMGFAFVEKEKILKEVCWTTKSKTGNINPDLHAYKRLTKGAINKALKRLEGEVKAMNMLNSGEVYGIKVVDIDSDKEDSCWGFYADMGADLANCVQDMIYPYCADDVDARRISREAVEADRYDNSKAKYKRILGVA